MSESTPAYLLEWDPTRVWDADFNIWLDASQYGAVWSPGSTVVPAAARLGKLRFHGVHSVVADDDYPVNDVGWSIVSEEMLSVLRSVGDFSHEAIPIEVVDAGADATSPPAVEQRFYMLHVPEHVDSSVLDEDACVAVRLAAEEASLDGMFSAPTSFVFDEEVLAEHPLPPFFRLAAYPWGALVSQDARDALEAAGIRSLRFVPLTDLPSAHYRSQLLDPWALERMVVETRPEEQGLDRHFRVLRSPTCDRATALRMYWFHGPAFFQQFANEDAIPPQQRVVRRLIDAIERRFASGMYKLRLLYFNPQDDGGFDWTTRFVEPGRIELYPLPSMMYEASGHKPADALSPQQRLFRVVAAGDRRAAQQLVMSGEVDLEAADDDEYGDTALHIAVRHDHADLVDLLVFQDADLNAQNRLRHAPLHVAAASGAVEVGTALLEAGADVDALAHSDRPIQLAARGGHTEMVRLLLDNGASLTGLGASRLLHDACEGRTLEVLGLLLERGVETDSTDVRGETALMSTCESGWLEGAQLLVERGHADVSREHAQTGQTALHAAANGNNAELVRWLLANGADTAKEDRSGQPALHVALRSGSEDAATALLEGHSEDATAALRVAMSWEGADPDSVRLLVDNGADPNVALRRAAKYGFGAIGATLLAGTGIDLSSSDDKGRTALHLGSGRIAGDASDEERAGLCHALLEAKADVDALDGAGATALHYAAAAGNAAVVAALLDAGADTSVKTTGPMDVGAETPVAAKSSAAKVAKILGHDALSVVL